MKRKWLAVGIILLFVVNVCAFCLAQISTPQNTVVKTSKELPVNKVRHFNTNDDDEDFFNFAIIWGDIRSKMGLFSFFL
jgi:hypothetical protein